MIYTIDKVKEIFREKGIKLISEKYKNLNSPLEYVCPKCNAIKEVCLKTVLNTNILPYICRDCRNHSKITIDRVREEFLKIGATLVSEKYIDAKSKLYFNCTICGRTHYTCWNNFQQGKNKNLVCDRCFANAKHTLLEIKEKFKRRGLELISDSYKDAHTKLKFKCPRCGGVAEITYNKFNLRYKDSIPVCSNCNQNIKNKPFKLGPSRRRYIDTFWYKLILEFFNISGNDYASHHILKYSKFNSFRTSLTNGYPLKKMYHTQTFVEPDLRIKNPFHVLEEFNEPKNWPDYAKLPYHNYKDFKFLNLSEVLNTEIIQVDFAKVKGNLSKLKEENKNIIYIPLFLEEVLSVYKRKIIFSIIKAKLYKFFPEIYKYTGTDFNKYYARKLTLKEISNSEIKDFLNVNHLQGFVPAAINIALLYGKSIISCMTFGKSRYDSNEQFELLRYCTGINTIVVGGAQKLFNFFIKKYNPDSIISYCDIRFSSADPKDTIYTRLGFDYIFSSEPNYRYFDEKVNRVYSRQQFQKHKLKNKLTNFDANLSEHQNMINNGYIRQYDCGNYKFIWRKR